MWSAWSARFGNSAVEGKYKYMKNIVYSLWECLDKIMRFAAFRILHLKISDEKWTAFLQFVKFGIVGVSNTVVSYVIYVIFLLLFQKWEVFTGIDYLVAQFIAFLLSVLWSFYWNRKYVFQADNEQVPWIQALLKTYLSYAFTGIFLNSVLSILWVQYLGIPKLVAPVANLMLSVPINFILNKFWAFKKTV